MADYTAPVADSEDPWKAWRGRIDASRRRRDQKIGDWQENVQKRKGEGNDNAASVSVNKDWPLTKAKTALLYSVDPQLRAVTEDERAKEFVPKFAKELNATIKTECVGAAIEEELADVTNASGISGVVIACAKRMVTKQMPSVDPALAEMAGMPVEMVDVQAVADIRYPVRRLSPASLLIPDDFKGSVYDQARWLGYEDSMPWVTAKVEFGLTDDDKDKVCGAGRRTDSNSTVNTDAQNNRTHDNDSVTYQEIFYWRHWYHEEETSFSALQRVVFVDGLEEPVINEEYKGQKRLEDGRIVGVLRNPIQILTLTYISDENLPPSDSTITRARVNELERSRNQQELQRKHSMPMRWGDTNRISPNTRERINSGDYQSFIWTNGPGERAIGEVARAAFPNEKYELDDVINREIDDSWQITRNQMGGYASGERSAKEAGIVERNSQTRIGQERSKVERHFVAIAEVLAGLMALHGNSPIPVELLGTVTYSVRVDSTVLLSAEQRMAQLERQIDRLMQMPGADVQPLVAEWLELGGSDPTKILHPPQPKPPEAAKVSVSNAVDLRDPLFLATLMHSQQGPTPQDIQAAVKAIQMATQLALGIQTAPAAPMQEGDPNAPPREGESLGMANSDAQMAPRQDRRDQDSAS